MAVKSGMVYSKVQALVDDLTQHLITINTIFETELVGGRVQEISECYDGQAAEIFKSSLTNFSRQVVTDLQDIINKLNIEVQTQQEAYNKQEKKLVENIPVQQQ